MIVAENYVPLGFLTKFAADTESNELEKYFEYYFSDMLPFITKRPLDILSEWIFDFCKSKLFASNGHSVLSLDAYSVFSFKLHHTNLKLDYSSIPEEIIENFYIGETLSDFAFQLEDEEGKKLARDLRKIYSCLHPEVFIQKRDFQIDFSFFKYLQGVPDIEPDFLSRGAKIMESLESIQGYFLCIPRAHFDESWNSFWDGKAKREETKIESAFGNLGGDEIGLGRPAIGPELLQIYQNLYPGGHGNLAWSKVHFEVQVVYRQPFHIDTLKRALGKK